MQFLYAWILEKFFPEYALNVTNLDENIALEDITNQLLEVKKLAQKISDEKKIMKSINFSVINSEFRQEALKNFAELQDQVKSRFGLIAKENEARADQVQEMITCLRNEVSQLKAQLVQNDQMLKSGLDVLEKEPFNSSKHFSDASVQTEESYEIEPQEISDCGLSNEEWISLKQCLSDATNESEKLWKDDILRFLNNLGTEYNGTKGLVMTLWEEINKEVFNCGSVLDQMHHFEQTVFAILIFLQQQSIDAQTVRETLKFFDSKFKRIVQRSDARWVKSSSNLQVAFESVQNAKAVLNVGSLTFKDEAMVCLKQKVDCLDKTVMEFGYTTKLLSDAEQLTHIIGKSFCDLINNVASLSDKIDGAYCQKIGTLSRELLVPGGKLEVFNKALGEFIMYIKSISSNTQAGNLESMQNHDKVCGEKTSDTENNSGNFLRKISFEDALKEIQKFCNEHNTQVP